MKRLLKSIVLSTAVAATTLTAIPTANAGDWHRRHVHKRDRDSGDALAAGLLGAAVGAIAAGVLVQPRRAEPVYIDPPRYGYRYERYDRDYYRPAPSYRTRVTYASPEPWSGEWYRACSARYRSFDPNSGTFMGYDGRRHFCTF